MAGETIILTVPDYTNKELVSPNVDDSIADVLLDQVAPVLPASGTIAVQGDVTGAHSTTDGKIDALNDLSSDDIETAVGTALATYDPPTKAEMDSLIGTPAGASVSADIAAVKTVVDGLSGMTANEKARLDLGFHQQQPLIETFRGYLHQPASFGVNSSITDAQVADQCARYNGAVAWAFTQDTTTPPTISVTSNGAWIQLSNSATAGKDAVVGALYPVFIRQTQYALLFPNDERFIWEASLIPDVINNTSNHAGMFFGMANAGVEDDWGGSYIAGWTNPSSGGYYRFGFCASSDAGYKMVGVCNNAPNIATTSAFTVDPDAINHFKMVYDIGTGITFYLNGESKGTLTTYLPTSGISASVQAPFLPIFGVYTSAGYAQTMQIFHVRCYFQNGA